MARLANAAGWVIVGVLRSVRMTARAVCLRSVESGNSWTGEKVLVVGDSFEMRGVNAIPNTTPMMNLQPLWNRAIHPFPCQPVNAPTLRLPVLGSINGSVSSAGESTSPYPAALSLNRVCGNSLPQGRINSNREGFEWVAMNLPSAIVLRAISPTTVSGSDVSASFDQASHVHNGKGLVT